MIFQPWALALVSIVTTCLAQNTTESSNSTSSAVELPTCALLCIQSAYELGFCSLTDPECSCTNDEFQTASTSCIAQNCTVRESLLTKNVTSAACGDPVRDLSATYANIAIIMVVISGFVVVMRLGFKLYEFRAISNDDWFVLATIISGVPSTILTIHGTTANGLGKDAWTVPFDQIDSFGMYFYIMAILYFVQVMLLKMTLLFFYLRIFPARNVRRLLWGTIAFNAIIGIIYVLITAFQCQPISHYWLRWDGEHEGTCLDINSIGWSNAIFSIVLDFWMIGIPLWQLRSMKLHWKKKVGVAMMFMVGTFVTVVSIIRLRTLVSFSLSENSTWLAYDLSLWSTIEINMGIICTCMPTLRLIIFKAIPALNWSSVGRSYYGTGRYGSRSKTLGNPGSANLSAVDSGGPTKGIMYQKSYNVQYSDETSLVYMQDMGTKSPRTPKSMVVSQASSD